MKNNGESQRSAPSTATLICDYSENELNQLLLNTNEAMALDNADDGKMLQANHGSQRTQHSSPGKQPGASLAAANAEKYNQLTRLHDEEENVDFIQMFNQY